MSATLAKKRQCLLPFSSMFGDVCSRLVAGQPSHGDQASRFKHLLIHTSLPAGHSRLYRIDLGSLAEPV